jgi:predicted nucleotidyltransferase
MAYNSAMVRRQRIQQNIDEIRQIASRHGASNVRLFGSIARGDENEDSDLDLIVSFDPGRTLLDHGALVMDLQELLGFRVDVLSEAGLKGRFREQALREAVPI